MNFSKINEVFESNAASVNKSKKSPSAEDKINVSHFYKEAIQQRSQHYDDENNDNDSNNNDNNSNRSNNSV